MKTVHNPLAKSVIIPLGFTAAASAIGAAIQKETFRSDTKALVFSNEDLNDIMEIVTSLEDAGLLIKGVSEVIENKGKEQKGEFLGMLLGTPKNIIHFPKRH